MNQPILSSTSLQHFFRYIRYINITFLNILLQHFSFFNRFLCPKKKFLGRFGFPLIPRPPGLRQKRGLDRPPQTSNQGNVPQKMTAVSDDHDMQIIGWINIDIHNIYIYIVYMCLLLSVSSWLSCLIFFISLQWSVMSIFGVFPSSTHRPGHCNQ